MDVLKEIKICKTNSIFYIDKQYYIYMNTKTLCSQFNKMCPVFFLPLFVATDGNMQVDVPQYYKKQFFFFLYIRARTILHVDL